MRFIIFLQYFSFSRHTQAKAFQVSRTSRILRALFCPCAHAGRASTQIGPLYINNNRTRPTTQSRQSRLYCIDHYCNEQISRQFCSSACHIISIDVVGQQISSKRKL